MIKKNRKSLTFYGDHVPLTSYIPHVAVLSSFLASPLVRTADHISSRQNTRSQELLLLSQEVSLRVSWLGTSQHPSKGHKQEYSAFVVSKLFPQLIPYSSSL